MTSDRVLEQLKYRYEREINLAQRSALKKILEKDEASARYMILCVACVKELTMITPKIKNGEGEETNAAPVQVAIIELTGLNFPTIGM